MAADPVNLHNTLVWVCDQPWGPANAVALAGFRRVFRAARNRERERRPRSLVRRRPDAAAMALDDRATDGQPDTHPAFLGRVKGIEQLVDPLTVDAHAGIANGQAHMIAVLSLGSDYQLTRAIVDVCHRV